MLQRQVPDQSVKTLAVNLKEILFSFWSMLCAQLLVKVPPTSSRRKLNGWVCSVKVVTGLGKEGILLLQILLVSSPMFLETA